MILHHSHLDKQLWYYLLLPSQLAYKTLRYIYVTDNNDVIIFNPLDSKGNYSATSSNTKLVHWLLMGGLLHLVQQGGAWVGSNPTQSPPRCTKCNSPYINGQCTNQCIVAIIIITIIIIIDICKAQN